MAGRFPTLFVNVGHIHNYLGEIRPTDPIGIVANAMYPPTGAELRDPGLHAAVRLLDPVTYELALPVGNQHGPFARLPYADANVNPTVLAADRAARGALIDAVAGQSRTWGADLVITPYFHAVDPGDPAFAATLTLATAAADRLGVDQVIPAVFLDQNALLPQHRDDLLNELTRTDFDVLYLVVGVDSPSTAPIANDAVLGGIRIVVEVSARNGIEVVWGATDTTGLLAVAWAPGTSFALGPDTHFCGAVGPQRRAHRHAAVSLRPHHESFLGTYSASCASPTTRHGRAPDGLRAPALHAPRVVLCEAASGTT